MQKSERTDTQAQEVQHKTTHTMSVYVLHEDKQASKTRRVLHLFPDLVLLLGLHGEVNTLLTQCDQVFIKEGTIGTILRSLWKSMQLQDHFNCLCPAKPLKPKNTSIKSFLEYSSTLNPLAAL